MPPIAILVALADPTRCRIIEILRAGPQPVHQIAAAFDISRPAISRHLGVLKGAKLIREKKVGRENRYALDVPRLKPVRTWIDGVVATPGATPPAAPATVAPVPVTPVPVAPVVAAAKPRKTAAVAQMGFDF